MPRKITVTLTIPDYVDRDLRSDLESAILDEICEQISFDGVQTWSVPPPLSKKAMKGATDELMPMLRDAFDKGVAELAGAEAAYAWMDDLVDDFAEKRYVKSLVKKLIKDHKLEAKIDKAERKAKMEELHKLADELGVELLNIL